MVYKNNKNTSWGQVANWYDSYLKKEDSYQSVVIWPNLKRLVDLKPNESMLEIACGQGFFLNKFYDFSKNIFGIDIGSDLIKIAQKNNPKIKYAIANAEDLNVFPDTKFDVINIILALQNIKNLDAVSVNISRMLKDGGRAFIVLNHPFFRIPQKSDWHYDAKKNLQGRIVDSYMSNFEIKINMHPGKDSKYTYSFHRPLQVYSKSFAKNNLAIFKIEEWVSHKKSQKGQRSSAEDRARKEFPMFMCLELRKISI
ncbi:MAG TPA: class I SAM-dependent methyltransferase [Candidatus Paceibacterota bacterium]|nr:class I SAM-dependent methyltransferase [Candidatus Paceibacterota bacterium]HMP18719.1 class I SAM-dependent methyltransferase [Candidatus Paceibacterota bacterium]HMP85488.1 class I SAM-dependent methyltransferase [Candidatus Paceibacterota bacterium]